ncbi:MAG: ABC transporter substrate binding protein, partial [Limnochordales bacterium]
MSINRSSLMIAVLAVLVLAFSSLAAPLRVGVTQIVEHPALDAARQGFIDRLAELGYEEGTDVV